MVKNVMEILRGDKFFQLIVTILVVIFFCLELYPILYVISASFSDPHAISSGRLVLWPVDFTVEGYKYVLQHRDIWIGYGNTILYTVAGTLVNLVLTLPCAYALSRKEMIGRNKIMIVFMITMYISGGLIPGYLNIKSFGLLNSRILMIINGGISVYNMIVARTFFGGLPNEIIEAAQIDGCSHFGTLEKIILPLSKAITAVMLLYYGVGHWNSYFDAMIFLDDRDKYPLQMFLREILIQSNMMNSMSDTTGLTPEMMEAMEQMTKNADLTKYCVIIISTIPMMVVYPRLQKFFEKGVMIGSIKG